MFLNASSNSDLFVEKIQIMWSETRLFLTIYTVYLRIDFWYFLNVIFF